MKKQDAKQNCRVVVLGGTGMLGFMVWTYLAEHDFCVLPSFRDARPKHDAKRRVTNIVIKHKNSFQFAVTGPQTPADITLPECDYVINCIGSIPQRQPTQPEMLYTNCLLPRNLAEKYAASKTRVINISTDCVFDGRRGWYNEFDESSARDWYGVSKAMGESHNIMNIRTSIIGPERDHIGTNIYEWMRRQAGGSTIVRGYVDHYWNGVTTLQLARSLAQIIQNDLYESGIFHIFSRRAISKYEMLKEFNRRYNLNVDLRPHETGRLVDRTLATAKPLCQKLAIPTFEHMLDELDDVMASSPYWL